MYAKLFSRIAQSSLMEEKVTTRYVFMMLLALSDRHGEVIGTDIAIARMMNVPKDDFCESLKPLLEPDPDSNSPAEEGRRVIASESGRGYKIVNYTAYRDIKSDDEKREYMRQYMRQRRQKDKESAENVNPVKPCKTLLNDVTHTEAEADTEVKAKTKRFIKPTIDELRVFCKSIGHQESDGDAMFYMWESNGWKNGKSPCKDWKAGVRRYAAEGWLASQKQTKTYAKPLLSRDDRHPQELKEETDLSTLPVWDAMKNK